jgi:hypothetical protein
MYKLTQSGSVVRLADNALIPDNNLNRDWQEYQIWLAAGNSPEQESISDSDLINAIRDEAYRRIILIFSPGGNSRDGEAKQRNLIAQATQLLKKGSANWTANDVAAWDSGQALWDRVIALRNDSNALENSIAQMTGEEKAAFNPLDNAHWSE